MPRGGVEDEAREDPLVQSPLHRTRYERCLDMVAGGGHALEV